MQKSTSIIPNPSRQTVLTPKERLFSQSFIRDFQSPHARQHVGKSWKTYYHDIPDQFIKNHIRGDFWLGTKACWYPSFYNLDVDNPTPERIEQLENLFDTYKIAESQRLYLTSPSHAKSGNFRIYLRLEYNGTLPTFKLGNKVLSRVFSQNAEIYPQKRRKDRLPCGRNQHIICDGVLLKNLTWEQELHYFLKLDPIDIDVLPRTSVITDPSQPTAAPITPTGDVDLLLKNGLEKFGTRYEAQYQILNFLWRNNWMPGDSSRFVKSWIRTKNNGFSDKVNKSAWRTINDEIDRQVKSIWARTALSDNPNNLTNQITNADLVEAAQMFPGDAVRQKQFINLVGYYRPRAHHDFVFISYRLWTEEIAGSKTYKSFINDLKKRGILESVDSYQVGGFSRKFRLKLPNSSAAIQQDNRNVTDYYGALRAAFNNDPKVIAEAMKLNRMTIWRHLLKTPA
jgi:hypothetical protein